MNPRKRLIAALEGNPTDHTPIWLLFPYHETSYYVNVRTHPQYQRVIKSAGDKIITLNRRNLGSPTFTEDVVQFDETIKDGDTTIAKQGFRYKGRELATEKRVHGDDLTIKKLIDNENDLELFVSLPIETDSQRLEDSFKPHVEKYNRERQEFPLESGAMMLDLSEPITPLYHNSNLEEYAIWSLTHEDQVISFLDKYMEQKRWLYRKCLDANLADVYFLVGSELASPPMVSRATFQKWIVPYATELIEMVHKSGKYAIQHYHGQIKEILPDFLTMNPDALHTIEEPPIGNCTMEEAYDIIGDKITLIGNIQYDDFRSLTPDLMAEQVKELLKRCENKRFILSPTAGPFDENVSEQVILNYLKLIEAAWN